MTTYKLKHIKSGLFFTPSKGNGNLSKKGKIYIDRKPDIKYGLTLRIIINSYKSKLNDVDKLILDTFNIKYENKFIDIYVETKISDWEIVNYNSQKEEIEKIVADIRNKLGPILTYFKLNKIKDKNEILQKYLNDSASIAEETLPLIIKQLNNLNNL